MRWSNHMLIRLVLTFAVTVLVSFALCPAVQAAVRLSSIFSDGMVHWQLLIKVLCEVFSLLEATTFSTGPALRFVAMKLK